MKLLRKHVRLSGYDYSTPGAYFVTTCTDHMRCLFGEISNGTALLNDCGIIARECWEEIPQHFIGTEIDIFQVMPNHVHGVLLLSEHRHKLGNIVGPYKAAVTRRIRSLPGFSKVRVWEISFHEHIIRKQDSLERVREYIVNNPMKWELDRYHPSREDAEDDDDWSEIVGDES